MAELKMDFAKMAEGFTKTAKEKGMFVGWWIPVSERLPEESIPVILTMEIPVFKDKPRREVVLASCHRFCKDKYKWLTYEDEPSIIDFPIAWMPLPEPYKGESEEQDADSN